MSKVFYEPWVGTNYTKGIKGKRIMVMGHVHVCSGCNECGNVKERNECAFFTQNVVKDYLQWRSSGEVPSPEYRGWLKTYHNFAKAFLGLDADIERETTDLWDNILFYNYLQTSVPSYSSIPENNSYLQAQEPFIEVMNKYVPDLIIAWGNGAYDYIPEYNGHTLSPLVFENIMSPRYEYTLESGKKCIIMKIHHPSMFFSVRKWHELIHQAL